MNVGRRLGERTMELCRIPSPYGNERALCDHLEAWARGHFEGDDIFRHRDSLVLGRAGRTDRPTVALVGHLDTVPPHEDSPPAALDEERVVGLGASDMKGGLAVAMALIEDLDRSALPVELLLVLYEKEEGPHEDSGLRALLDEQPSLKKVDLAFVMEPTDNRVQIGCVGSIHATVVFTGKAAHSARPWHGSNAVTAAGALLAQLHDRAPVEVPFGDQVFREVWTVTGAQGGRYRNVVPDRFELNLNYRFAPGKSLDEAQAELEALVGAQARVEYTDLAPSGGVPRGNALFDRFVRESGLPVEPKQAWTDVARLTEVGVDAVNFGPGLTSQAHQAGEYCDVALLEANYQALRSFLEAASE